MLLTEFLFDFVLSTKAHRSSQFLNLDVWKPHKELVLLVQLLLHIHNCTILAINSFDAESPIQVSERTRSLRGDTWTNFFDGDGRLVNESALRKAIFKGSVILSSEYVTKLKSRVAIFTDTNLILIIFVHSLTNCLFILRRRKYSQAECRKTAVYSAVNNPRFPCSIPRLGFPPKFSMAKRKIVIY